MSEKIRVALVIDKPGISAAAEGAIVWGWDYTYLCEKLRKAGIREEEVAFESALDEQACLAKLNSYPNLTVIVPLGEHPLQLLTGKKSISKWHLSPLEPIEMLACRKAIPSYPPSSVRKDMALGLYLEKALVRARENLATREFIRKPKRFHLNPGLKETYEILDYLDTLTENDFLSVDVETGRGQINTMGFAWTVSDAIAIQTLPGRLGPDSFFELWCRIAKILRGPTKKVMQNGIYEMLYCARYGISIANFAHDSMVAQKFLLPELEKGLDNVGRLHTNEPYWKDTGRIESEEGKRKDWGDIRDWPRHFLYNCLDTSGTFEGALSQREEMKERGLLAFYDSYLMKLHPIMSEMCLRGLPVCLETQKRLIEEHETKIATLSGGLSMQFEKGKKQISAITRTQKIKLLEAKGYKIPLKKNKETGKLGKSVDELSLKMLLQKHPDDTDIPKLLKIAEYEKALSSYFRVDLDPFDAKVRFMMDVHGTETGRWSSSLDAWSRGFNAQTMPGYVKEMIRWE